MDPKSPADSPGIATTDKYIVADAYLIRMTELIANMSTTLGFKDKAETYKAQISALLEKFRESWIVDGEMANRTQTAYVLSIHFGLLTDEQRQNFAKISQDIVVENNYLVGTGFAGTPFLGFALTEIGPIDYFYAMLLQTQVPPWLYQVVMNGTTTWERWDSLLPNGTVNPGQMTSFNHYAFGSVSN